jgi:phage baseplate assembly protein V
VLASSASKLQSLQMRLTAGEVNDDMEHFEPYGFTSNPLAGAEGVVTFLGGDRSHAIALVIADRRYRLQSLQSLAKWRSIPTKGTGFTSSAGGSSTSKPPRSTSAQAAR